MNVEDNLIYSKVVQIEPEGKQSQHKTVYTLYTYVSALPSLLVPRL